MALTAEQRWIATKIDTRMRKLSGKDDRAIFAAMVDHMRKVKQLLSTTSQGDLDLLIRTFPGLSRYAQVLSGWLRELHQMRFQGRDRTRCRGQPKSQSTTVPLRRRLTCACDN